MKKTYRTPVTAVVIGRHEALLRANSIDHGNGDVQQGITDNGDEDFEAGAKENGTYNPWDKWDE